MPAITHRLGMVTPRWGSLAIMAPPLAERDGATAKELEPDRTTPLSRLKNSAVRVASKLTVGPEPAASVAAKAWS